MADTRRLHFVGTMPQFGTAAEAFTWQLTELGAQVRRLSGGETGPRLAWFVPLVKELKRHPKIRAVREGDWTDYDDVDRLAVRRGEQLTSGDIPLHLAEWAKEELAVLEDSGSPATPDRPLQIGVPGYLDMALFIFGPSGAIRHGRAFLDAVAAQIEEISAVAGDRVVYQLETPAALIAVSSAPPPIRAVLADLMSRMVLRQVASAPQRTRFGLHLCFGDMGHEAKLQPKTAAPLVTLANALQRHWPQGSTLEYLHLPLCGGQQPPSTDPAFYAPLKKLNGEPPLVAGIAHEAQPLADQFVVRRLVEDAVGRPVDIATACGLGRRTPEQAADAVARMRALLG
ncbi:hypothetical protein [Kribbella lupini]|uniref:Cobalamin-independent methionine synthase MetE C-terminal/archaeal domain-containing protein n=1 Tax=Kribbella lupini TaxID=291602 RepID=A0ABP4LG84_9ACTN